jgi:hypothetical protein
MRNFLEGIMAFTGFFPKLFGWERLESVGMEVKDAISHCLKNHHCFVCSGNMDVVNLNSSPTTCRLASRDLGNSSDQRVRTRDAKIRQIDKVIPPKAQSRREKSLALPHTYIHLVNTKHLVERFELRHKPTTMQQLS